MSRVYRVELQAVELSDVVDFTFMRNSNGAGIISRTRYNIRGTEVDENGDPVGEEEKVFINKRLQLSLPSGVQSSIINLVNTEIIPGVNAHENL